MQDIYKLGLFEVALIKDFDDSLEGLTVRRVPGGWTFTEWTTSANIDADKNHERISSVFVPYDEEFLRGPSNGKL